KPAIYLPIAFSLVLILGLFLGSHMINSQDSGWSLFKTENRTFNRLVDVLNLIQQDYVDEIDTEEITKIAVKNIIEELDPHSEYIPASQFAEVNDQLKGNFEGIGIQFRMVKDTIVVIKTIAKGPSEKAGIMAGDRIVQVNGKTVAGKGISSDSIVSMLKGKRNTEVEVSVYRRGMKNLLDFTITRDKIPTYSLDVAYMIDDETGYVKLNKFSATTGDELHKALIDLKGEGLEKLILDLRGNGGGYLSESIRVSDEFIKDDNLIVYTEGKNRPRREQKATAYGSFHEGDLVIIIDEMSASASEIVAGAVQDNDRGTILGRRSFGKGLVQEQMQFKNGAAIRLTVARYYTPTGRCIQKSYENGNNEDYYLEILNRYQGEEMNNMDSVPKDSTRIYVTNGGDTVYGGGGIYPDIFIPLKKGLPNELAQKIIRQGLIFRFAFQYADRNREQFARFDSAKDFVDNYQVNNALYNEFKTFTFNQGIKGTSQQFKEAKPMLKTRMKAFIGRNFFDDQAFYPVIHQIDVEFQEALRFLN
ncbi:MAG: S41 family peptidase, partial [Bacteroidales bacterium]|nr:S41 family peptidase [Bacteroidales bacterium]